MRRLACLFALGFFFVSPGFACGPGDPEYQYGAAEMRQAAEGRWALTITPTGGTAQMVTVDVVQANTVAVRSGGRGGVVRSANACGQRTLVRSAAACIDSSTMPLTVTFVSGDAALASPLGGSFDVFSTVFTEGELVLLVGPYHMFIHVAPDGTVKGVDQIVMPGPTTTTGTATAVRL